MTKHEHEISLGRLGCGELIYELRQRFEAVPAGGTVRVITEDATAHSEIPAWCRMTGHRLDAADPPHYFITARSAEPGQKGD